MAGENYDPYQHPDPDYDGMGSDAVNMEELTFLLEAVNQAGSYPDTEGRQDWALERECEISRLEGENEELRRLLGIDEARMAAQGVTLDLDRCESGRYSTLLSNARRTSSNDSYVSRPSYWENNNNNQMSGSLQRPMELQPGMRVGPQRRTGMFGVGQQRGGFVGRGMNMGVGGTPINSSVWTSQPTGPPRSPPLPDRGWQLQGPPSGLDLNR
jgi:hypothetical protein